MAGCWGGVENRAMGCLTQSWRSGPQSGADRLACVGARVDAGLSKPVRPQAFCDWT